MIGLREGGGWLGSRTPRLGVGGFLLHSFHGVLIIARQTPDMIKPTSQQKHRILVPTPDRSSSVVETLLSILAPLALVQQEWLR